MIYSDGSILITKDIYIFTTVIKSNWFELFFITLFSIFVVNHLQSHVLMWYFSWWWAKWLLWWPWTAINNVVFCLVKSSSLFLYIVYCYYYMTSSYGNIFRAPGPLWGESTSQRWIPLTKASDAELWCLLWPEPEQMVKQTIVTPVIWDAIVLIMTSL